MEKQPGYCDRCGADIRRDVAWLTITGGEHCTACALDLQAAAVMLPKHPEARDDGR